MIKIPATIEKSQISELVKLKGHANAGLVKVAGEQYDPGHLQFCGFAGKRGDDLRYHGFFGFETCLEGSCRVAAFDFLEPLFRSKPQAARQIKSKGRDE